MTAKAVTGIFLVFFLGAVAGGLLSSIFFAHRAAAMLQRGGVAYVELLERHAVHGLGLSPDQKERIHNLFMANLAERQRLQLQIQPQIQALNMETMRQIRTVLKPDQEPGFRENLREFHRRYGRRPECPDVRSGRPARPGEPHQLHLRQPNAGWRHQCRAPIERTFEGPIIGRAKSAVPPEVVPPRPAARKPF